MLQLTPDALAQATPDAAAAPTTANDAASSQPVAHSANTGVDPHVQAQLDALTRRIEAQEAELARQRAELEQARTAQASADPAIAELLQTQGEEAPRAFEPALRIYGFMDVGLQRAWGGMYRLGLSLSDATNFVLGNVNVYFDATPAEHIRALTEVRFTNFPHGAESTNLSSGDFERGDTGVLDHTSSAGGFVTVRWAGIVLERAHIDYTPLDALNIRAGYFLTPYGIWNVDHGSPTRIMLRPPYFVSLEFLPERQTGVEIFGKFHALPWELGYHAYVSNGRTLGAVDFDDDKAVGGRLFARTRRPIPIQLGASVFTGSAENTAKSAAVLPSGAAAVKRVTTVAYDELAAAADVSVDAGPLRLRSEFVARRLVYERGKRPTYYGHPNASMMNFGAYLMAAYRLPFWNLELLAEEEMLRYPTVEVGEIALIHGGGFNVYFDASTTLRVQYGYVRTLDLEESSRDHSGNDYHLLSSRLIIAF